MDIQDNCNALNNAENATFKVVSAQKIEHKCFTCNTSCNSNSQLEAHLRSNKHHDTMKMHEKHDGYNNQCENVMVTEDKEARLHGLIIIFVNI